MAAAVSAAKVGRAVAFVAAVAAVFATASCTSASPDRAVEKRNCASVGRLTGAPPGTSRLWIRQVTMARRSGNEILDTAMHGLVVGLDENESSRISAAITRVRTVCGSLGLWQVYH
jgi:hypothetical protein